LGGVIADARPRGIVDGDVVKVFNERGAFLAGVIVSDANRLGGDCEVGSGVACRYSL